MAVVHHTTLKPTKRELLTAWLPTRSWYLGGADTPVVGRAGGFRLDDPEGEVGIEFAVVTDGTGPQHAAYLVPFTYRGAPLEGAEHALVGTMEHGVLGQRWAYDGCHDPVLVAQLLALIEGRVQAQDAGVSNTLDHDIARTFIGDAPFPSKFTAPVDDHESTQLITPSGEALRLRRVLHPASDDASLRALNVVGDVSGSWKKPDGTSERATFAVLHAGTSA
jgi:hypothetical protein